MFKTNRILVTVLVGLLFAWVIAGCTVPDPAEPEGRTESRTESITEAGAEASATRPAATATDPPTATATATATDRPVTNTPRPPNTPRPTNTAPAATSAPLPTATAPPPATSAPLPTVTDPPVATSAPLPTATLAPTAEPTAVPPTAEPTAVPPTAEPTAEPPTAEPAPGQVIIINVNKQDEYVDIQNIGGQPQDLSGWTLLSEKGAQSCALGGVLQPGQVLRIWAMAQDADKGGYNCGFGSNIWNNSESDPAVLFDANGNEVSRK